MKRHYVYNLLAEEMDEIFQQAIHARFQHMCANILQRQRKILFI